MRNHLPDYPQIDVCPVDGIFLLDKYTSSAKTSKAIFFRVEIKRLLRESTDRDKQLSTASDTMVMPTGTPHQRIAAMSAY